LWREENVGNKRRGALNLGKIGREEVERRGHRRSWIVINY